MPENVIGRLFVTGVLAAMIAYLVVGWLDFFVKLVKGMWRNGPP